ncbi:MAG: DUF3955 domain-containing protein [Proteocatella sp.]
MKKYLVSIIFVLIGVACSISYNIIGSEVAADGTLVEPFFLIPIGFLSIFLSIITGLIISLKARFRNPKKCDKIILLLTSSLTIIIVLSISIGYIKLHLVS